MKKIFLAAINVFLGLTLGLVLFEAVLRANPGLLLKGMMLTAPVDAPLVEQTYEVYASDADIFYWQSDIVAPILPDENILEAVVRYHTDEFGFNNLAPLPSWVDLVILGRSFSLGAQASVPWPRRLEKQTGMKVLNLSQAGSSIATKTNYLLHYGIPRHPSILVIEVLPSMDILDYSPSSEWILQDLPFPIIHNIGRSYVRNKPVQASKNPIYPLHVTIGGREYKPVFFSHYLAALTVTKKMLESSNQWKDYRSELLRLIQFSRSKNICPVLLYVPTKENIYFPLVDDPDQLELVKRGMYSWKLNGDQDLSHQDHEFSEIRDMQARAASARDLILEFSHEHGILMIDPTGKLAEAVLAGIDPYMSYDTHWNDTGHRIIAEEIAEYLQKNGCP